MFTSIGRNHQPRRRPINRAALSGRFGVRAAGHVPGRPGRGGRAGFAPQIHLIRGGHIYRLPMGIQYPRAACAAASWWTAAKSPPAGRPPPTRTRRRMRMPQGRVAIAARRHSRPCSLDPHGFSEGLSARDWLEGSTLGPAAEIRSPRAIPSGPDFAGPGTGLTGCCADLQEPVTSVPTILDPRSPNS
jgi:hypothetical protein